MFQKGQRVKCVALPPTPPRNETGDSFLPIWRAVYNLSDANKPSIVWTMEYIVSARVLGDVPVLIREYTSFEDATVESVSISRLSTALPGVLTYRSVDLFTEPSGEK